MTSEFDLPSFDEPLRTATFFAPAHNSTFRALSPIGWRLTGVIALVSFVALALLTTVTLVFATVDTSTLADQRNGDLAHAVASSLAVSYQSAGSWPGADLSAPLALATNAGIEVRVNDSSGAPVATATPHGVHQKSLGQPLTLPILAAGRRVGTVTVRVGPTGIGALGKNLRGTLEAAVAGSAAVVALLALVAGLFVARRITRPVSSLTSAARAMATGDLGVRVGAIEASTELTELAATFDRLADTLERQDHLRRAFVADVAHELRTPLAILQASTEALADGIAEPSAEALASLTDETLRMSRMVQDLEVLASAEAAGLTLVRHPVDLAEVANQAADALAPRIAAADLILVRSLNPAVVAGDKARLHQVVTNLLTNAIKFTPAGGRITISVGISGNVARLVVADTGAGIPNCELSHVFERFWRGRDAQRVAGSGIGLAVVAELVQAHGGNVCATSEIGQGARFIVELPSL